jgi:hypothetical protein
MLTIKLPITSNTHITHKNTATTDSMKNVERQSLKDVPGFHLPFTSRPDAASYMIAVEDSVFRMGFSLKTFHMLEKPRQSELRKISLQNISKNLSSPTGPTTREYGISNSIQDLLRTTGIRNYFLVCPGMINRPQDVMAYNMYVTLLISHVDGQVYAGAIWLDRLPKNGHVEWQRLSNLPAPPDASKSMKNNYCVLLRLASNSDYAPRHTGRTLCRYVAAHTACQMNGSGGHIFIELGPSVGPEFFHQAFPDALTGGGMVLHPIPRENANYISNSDECPKFIHRMYSKCQTRLIEKSKSKQIPVRIVAPVNAPSEDHTLAENVTKALGFYMYNLTPVNDSAAYRTLNLCENRKMLIDCLKSRKQQEEGNRRYGSELIGQIKLLQPGDGEEVTVRQMLPVKTKKLSQKRDEVLACIQFRILNAYELWLEISELQESLNAMLSKERGECSEKIMFSTPNSLTNYIRKSPIGEHLRVKRRWDSNRLSLVSICNITISSSIIDFGATREEATRCGN